MVRSWPTLPRFSITAAGPKLSLAGCPSARHASLCAFGMQVTSDSQVESMDGRSVCRVTAAPSTTHSAKPWKSSHNANLSWLQSAKIKWWEQIRACLFIGGLLWIRCISLSQIVNEHKHGGNLFWRPSEKLWKLRFFDALLLEGTSKKLTNLVILQQRWKF